MHEYDKEILRVLIEAGSEGISVQKISRHVFNACNTFFNPVEFGDVHDYVLQYLQRNSKQTSSLISRTATRGVYCLNQNSQQGQQLMLQFEELFPEESDDSGADKDPSLDLSLSLF